MILGAPWLGEALSSAIVDIVLPSKGPNADPECPFGNKSSHLNRLAGWS